MIDCDKYCKGNKKKETVDRYVNLVLLVIQKKSNEPP